MAVNIDIKNGSTWRRDKNGDRGTRVAIISGVTGDVDALLKTALDDASMPNYGDAHPADSTITLQSITVTPLGGGQYRAQMEYFNDPANATGAANASINVSAGTSTDNELFDINGDPFYVTYSAGATFIKESLEAAVERPRTTIDIEYTSTTYPRAIQDSYQGRVNSDAWNGYAPETVLCVGVNVDERASGEYQVRMSFSYNADTWKYKAMVSQPDVPLGVYPVADPAIPELDYTTGEATYTVYETVAFAALGITIGGTYVEMSGTAAGTITETDVSTGGKTIILTLTNDTWVASGATFDGIRQDIIDGLVSNKSEATGFTGMTYPVTDVVRTSDTVVTITLSAQGTYNITQTEKITAVVPTTALVSSSFPLRASQKITVTTV